MTKGYRARIFKSGNSTALRLPRELGFSEGEEIVLVPHADGTFSFWKESEALNVLMGLYGAFSEGFMSDGRGDIEQVDYAWPGSSKPSQAA